MLITSTYVGRDNLQDDAVITFAISQGQFGKVNIVNLNDSRLLVDYASIASHTSCLLKELYSYELNAKTIKRVR